MIIKPPDSLQARLAAQRATLPATDPASEARLRGLHQHLRGLQHSANDLDAQLADGTRWALLHDLHLRIDGRSLWIDHLLINRQLDILLLASPHYGDSLSVDEQGEFFREVRGRRLGFASPLSRLHRQLALLRTWSRQLAWPYRQGGPLTPSWLFAVLLAPHADSEAPAAFAELLLRPHQLNDWLAIHTRHPERSTLDTLAHSVSVDTLRGFAQQWRDRHIGPEQAG